MRAHTHGELFETLFAASGAAHALGAHEAAYHALTAAMHAAVDTGDATRLRAVAREAEHQLGWLDAHAPAHRIGTAAAAEHHHPGMYALLARQAEGHAIMIEQQARMAALSAQTATARAAARVIAPSGQAPGAASTTPGRRP